MAAARQQRLNLKFKPVLMLWFFGKEGLGQVKTFIVDFKIVKRFMQGSKGIRQWPINWFTSLMLTGGWRAAAKPRYVCFYLICLYEYLSIYLQKYLYLIISLFTFFVCMWYCKFFLPLEVYKNLELLLSTSFSYILLSIFFSVTASVNLIWGCKFMSPSTGIIMNNQE